MRFWQASAIGMLLWLAVTPVLPLAAVPQPAATTEPQADHLFQQGQQQYQTGQLEAAVNVWQQARRAYQQSQDHQGEAATLENMGAAYLDLGRYRDAIAALEAYLPLARSLKQTQAEARALSNLGIAYLATGAYTKAIKAHQQAGKLLRQLGDRQGLAQVLVNLGNAFEAVGNYDNATIAYEQSIHLARQVGDAAGEAIALGNLGAIHANLGEDTQAIALYEQSLALNQKTGNRQGQASILINLGATYHALRETTKAKTYYQQALEIAQSTGDRQRQTEALGSLGLVAEDLKDYPAAIALHQQSLAAARSLSNPEAESRALNNLGHAQLNAGQFAAAATTVETATRILDNLRSQLSDRYSVSLFDTQLHTYSLLQQIRIAANQPELALVAAEQGRARAFAARLAQRLAINDQSAIAAPISVPAIQRIAQQQQATLVEYAIVPADDFKFRGKQRAKEAALYIWVVQPTGAIHFRQVPLQPDAKLGPTPELATPPKQPNRGLPAIDLSNLVSQNRSTMRGLGIVAAPAASPGSAPLSFNPEPDQVTQQLKQLHQVLIAPIADLLPTHPDDRVIFIPQEALFLVPFPALRTADGTALIEQHTILTAPAIQVLDLTRQQRDRQRQEVNRTRLATLIVGNPVMPSVTLTPGTAPTPLPPLPGAEQEATTIAHLLHSPVLIGNQATETAIKQQLPHARLAHLATHGLLEYASERGLQRESPGAIALTATATDDGLLTTTEILQLRLQAELVVLSACDTGQGKITGDGVIGLSRALITAGVPSVVVSLWSVPDAPTAKLMTTFYQALQQQPDKAKALRQAMLATMQEHPNPLNWAAFTLMGAAE